MPMRARSLTFTLFVTAAACSGGGTGLGGPTPYSVTAKADGPIAYWRFEEVSGPVAADSSGLGRAAAYLNAPILGDSLGGTTTGRAVRTAGTNDGINIPFATWTNLGALTVEVWIRPGMVTSSEGVILVDKGSTWNLFLDPAGKPAFQFPGGVPPETLAPTPVVAGQVYHLVGTFQAGVMRLYVNGALVSEATGLPSIPANSTDMHVGRGLSTDRFGFVGVIDEVALYDKVLSAATILAHYNAGG